MPTITNLLNKSKIDPREAELFLAFILKKDRPFILAHKSDAVNAEVAKRFLSLMRRRQKNEPIAYLTGSQPFFGRNFLVNRHVLIPRPETENLANLIKQHVQKSRHVSTIVDVGTGSGCLAVTLALACPSTTVIASDVSDKALAVARKNAQRLGAQVTFVRDNLLGKKLLSVIPATCSTNFQRSGKAGIQKNKKSKIGWIPHQVRDDNRLIFVANLPYLPDSDKKTIMPDITKYEPFKALFAGREGTEFIIKLLRQIQMLHVKCSMFFELDAPQAKKLMALARRLFPKHRVKIEKDLCGRERFLTIISL